MKNSNVLLSLFLGQILCLFFSQAVFCQTERLGIVQYTPPKGWTKSAKENIAVFSEVDQKAGTYCFITLYGATQGTGNPQKDFTREWNNLVVKPFGAEANPKTESDVADGWTITASAAAVEFMGKQSMAFLTVMSGGGKTVSLLGIFNDEAYMPQFAAFSSSLELGKAVAENPAPREEPVPETFPAASAATMHVAALVKEFETNEVRANQVWIGKRVRVYGTVNSIEIGKNGNIELTFKSSITTYNNGRCFFNKSQSSRVASLNSHTEATVEGTVRGLGGGFDNSKAFLLLEDCVVP